MIREPTVFDVAVGLLMLGPTAAILVMLVVGAIALANDWLAQAEVRRHDKRAGRTPTEFTRAPDRGAWHQRAADSGPLTPRDDEETF